MIIIKFIKLLGYIHDIPTSQIYRPIQLQEMKKSVGDWKYVLGFPFVSFLCNDLRLSGFVDRDRDLLVK